MAVKLSVNINKIATLRNSRGGNNPDVVKTAINCQLWGADGITVHPRPDERHIMYADVRRIKEIITTEFNIEGNPKEDKFVQLVLNVKPTQVTLVPDDPKQLTSNHGWNIANEKKFLIEILDVFKKAGIRTSIFLDADEVIVSAASETGTDRIELYTEAYAKGFLEDRVSAIKPYLSAAKAAVDQGLMINAGHDLDMHNLEYFCHNIPSLKEVSIGHALICDALFFGLQNTIQMYKGRLNSRITEG